MTAQPQPERTDLAADTWKIARMERDLGIAPSYPDIARALNVERGEQVVITKCSTCERPGRHDRFVGTAQGRNGPRLVVTLWDGVACYAEQWEAT